MSEGQGNISYGSTSPGSNGGGAGGLVGAKDGLSAAGGYALLGQTVGQAGDPAALTESREVPLGGNQLQFTSSTGGYVLAASIQVSGQSISGDGSDVGLTTWGREGSVSANNFGWGYQEFSFVDAFADFYGYSGVESWPYVNGDLGFQTLHGKFSNYIMAVSGGALWDGHLGAGNNQLANHVGHFNAAQCQSGSILKCYGYYDSEINTVGGTTANPPVSNHYNFYAEACTYATNNWGVYIDGPQPNYMAGSLGLGNNAPNAAAAIDIVSTTKGLLLPRMTTVQKNAIAAPPAGLLVYDTTLNKASLRTAAAWETVTSL